MERRSLEVTILSADDLSKVGILWKMQPYVVVSIDDSTSSSTSFQQTTTVDKNGNKNPRWNFPLKFSLNDAAIQTNNVTLHLQLFSRRTILPNTLIGQVHVSALDLSSVQKSSTATQVSYQIKRKTSGKPKGVVNFSYKFGDKFNPAPPPPRAEYPYPATAPPVGTGYTYPYEGRSNNGMGLGTGLLGGALAGLVLGHLLSDIGNDDDGGDYYDGDAGYGGADFYDGDAGYYDGGGFGF